MDAINQLPLHDALIESITINWLEKTVEVKLRAFIYKGSDAIPCILKFYDVSDTQIPHNHPWGESQFINVVSGSKESVFIEMQSGDIIRITGSGFNFDSHVL